MILFFERSKQESIFLTREVGWVTGSSRTLRELTQENDGGTKLVTSFSWSLGGTCGTITEDFIIFAFNKSTEEPKELHA